MPIIKNLWFFFGMKIAMRAWNFDGFIGKFGGFFFRNRSHDLSATLLIFQCNITDILLILFNFFNFSQPIINA